MLEGRYKFLGPPCSTPHGLCGSALQEPGRPARSEPLGGRKPRHDPLASSATRLRRGGAPGTPRSGTPPPGRTPPERWHNGGGRCLYLHDRRRVHRPSLSHQVAAGKSELLTGRPNWCCRVKGELPTRARELAVDRTKTCAGRGPRPGVAGPSADAGVRRARARARTRSRPCRPCAPPIPARG